MKAKPPNHPSNSREEIPPDPPADSPPPATHAVAFFMPAICRNQEDIVKDLVSRLDECLRELYEERAGIMEFDAGLSRDHAECLALLNIYRDHPIEVLGVSVLSKGPDEHILVTDPQLLAAMGLVGYRQGLVDKVIADLGGVVRITRFK